jgi:hypothetical protein
LPRQIDFRPERKALMKRFSHGTLEAEIIAHFRQDVIHLHRLAYDLESGRDLSRKGTRSRFAMSI